MAIVVYPSRCPQNHLCPSVKVCPTKALSQKGFKAPEVDKEKCMECKRCVSICPRKAIGIR